MVGDLAMGDIPFRRLCGFNSVTTGLQIPTAHWTAAVSLRPQIQAQSWLTDFIKGMAKTQFVHVLYLETSLIHSQSSKQPPVSQTIYNAIY